MKKILSFALLVLVAVILLQMTACKKLLDYIKHHPGQTVDSLCRIEKLTSYGYGTSDTNTLYFKYNAQGNPDSAVPPPAFKYLRPTYLFRYDNLGRLTELGCVRFGDSTSGYAPGDGGAYHWTYYFYTGDKITSSSTYYAGGYINGQPIFKSLSTFYFYEYDSLDRISKVTARYPFQSPVVVETPTYNAAGNLTTYATNDHKINIFRTNKIWMFLARDYSMNNPLTGATYNWLGLPVKTNQATGRTFLQGPLSVTPDHADIRYWCK